MTRKAVALILSAVLLLACAVPAFAMNSESAVFEVEAKIWLSDENTKYTVTDFGTYHEVVAIDHGVVYTFNVQDTDGVITLVSFDAIDTGFLTALGVLNAVLLTISALFNS